MRIPKCLNLFLENTPEGERNNNLFRAINHLKQFNKKEPLTNIKKVALQLNKKLQTPLNENEVENIVKSTSKNYKSNCYKFSKFCKRCNVGTRKKPYNQFRKKYWKTIKRNNTVVKTLTNGACLYPWDIVDTSMLSIDDSRLVRELRDSKGINPIIDDVLKLRGIKIGDEALEEWNYWNNKK
jgi:hypothetical protein